MRTVRWGILGCGDVCEAKSGPALQKAEGSALVAVMRRDAAKAADFARRHGVPRWHADAEALAADPEVDAVYVAAPPGAHLELALLAAKAGKPAYVEKPMARTHAECREMLEAFRAAGQPLFVAYYRRALPRFLKVKEWLDAGAVGAVRGVSITLARPTPPDPESGVPWRLRPETAGAGLFLDLASHTLDLLDFLLGPIAEARGLAANQSRRHAVEDAVAAAFSFGSGALGTGLWSFASARREDRVEILGSDGSIRFATFADGPIRLENGSGIAEADIPNPPHVQQPLIQAVVDALRRGGICPSTGESAARTSRVMDAILADYRATAASAPRAGP